jgi:hypothetical protein
MPIEIYPEDYEITPEDDDKMATIKSVIASMRPMERKIWLTYVESNYSQTAREFNVAVPTAKRYVSALRQKIIDKLNELNNDTATTDNNDNS